MRHLGTVTMETERLILRKCRPDDYREAFLHCCSDPELARLQNYDVHKTDDVTRRSFLEKAAQYETDPSFYEWAITDKASGTFMGEIALVHYDAEENTFETGYSIGRAFRRQGFMKEALAAVTDFALGTLGADAVYALILADNLPSRRCALSAGYVFVRTIPDFRDDVYEGPIDRYECTKARSGSKTAER